MNERVRWVCPNCQKVYAVPSVEGLTLCPTCGGGRRTSSKNPKAVKPVPASTKQSASNVPVPPQTAPQATEKVAHALRALWHERPVWSGLWAVPLVAIGFLVSDFRRRTEVPSTSAISDFTPSERAKAADAGANPDPTPDQPTDSTAHSSHTAFTRPSAQPSIDSYTDAQLKLLLTGTYESDTGTQSLSITFVYPVYRLNPSRNFVWAAGILVHGKSIPNIYCSLQPTRPTACAS